MSHNEKAEIRRKIGQMLRNARGQTSLNKTGVKIDVSTAYLSDVERGHRTVSAARLRQIADAVGMSETDRQRLFVAAQMLPPSVTGQVLRSPQAWSYSYRALFEFTREALQAAKTSDTLRNALGTKLFGKLERAMTKQAW